MDREVLEAIRDIMTSHRVLGLAVIVLYELTLGRGRYIAGFGQAFNVGPDTFRELS